MSHSTYNKLWGDAQVELGSLLNQELPAEPLRPEKDRVVFFQRIANLYVLYVQIFRHLAEAYDQVVHPQKRRAIRGVLDGVVVRVLELKNEMVEKEFSEYHYLDDVVEDLKLTPADIEIPIPRYFISERSKVLQERGAMLAKILNVMNVIETPKPTLALKLNLEESIKIIQVAERARQRRLRAKFMKEIDDDKERQRRDKDKDLGPAAKESAAICIQKSDMKEKDHNPSEPLKDAEHQEVWKGYIQRRRTARAREDELIFLGMAVKSTHELPCSATTAAEATKVHRRQKQKENEEDFQRATVAITDQLRNVEGPDIRETLKDQIRQWFIACRDATGSFPDYPEEEDGGSALIFAEKTLQELMEEMAAKEEEEDPNKKPKGKEEEGKGKKDKGKAEEEEEEEAGLKMLPSASLFDLEAVQKTFVDVWQNRDESTNYSQKHEVELIKEEKRKEIETEIRLQVDELMRQELANWKLAVDKDKSGRAKGSTKKKKGSKSGKKKKKDKDLTADRTLESLYQELVEEGLLKQTDNVTLQDYLGDYSYLGTTLRQTDIEPMPSLWDVRQILALHAILPLGSQVIHEKAPLTKAMLLVGPAGVGKKMLVHAICQETGANLFDLSPLNTAGKYPGKSGLAMMLHMVFKVARLMQPSVVWIGYAEKMFYKKVPKEEKELDPKRMKKDLLKVLKSIKAEDRVLIVGTTKDPLSADIKSLCKMFSKIILIPRPDYASRYIMWKQLIKKYKGEVTSALDLSSLAKISDGYTAGHMIKVICGILTDRRILQQVQRPLTAAEFVVPLAKIDPVFQDEEEALKGWYAKTPLGKKRVKAASGKEQEEPPAKGKDAKKKGKK